MQALINVQYPIGIFSDVHKNMDAVRALRESRPDVQQWVCLGDLFDFINPFGNEEVLNQYDSMQFPIVCGNHDSEWLRKTGRPRFPKALRLVTDHGDILCYHSLPNDWWTFVHRTLTEREFLDAYPLDERVKYVAIGHNHEQWKLTFPATDAELLSVGSLGYHGRYCVVHPDRVEFKTLTPETSASR